ncbi:Zinc finger, FYVE-related [Phytophthora cactorum]|nr:Zinc finger, FYVE-related [Phytophthora cactorum]
MKKSPVAAMSNIREAVRRKSVGLSFTTNFSIFSRGASSTGEDDRSEHEGDDYNDDSESSRYNRSRQARSPSPAVSSRSSYVEPPEPPLPPPGGLLEAATKNVQGKMQTLMETFHEVTTSHDDETIQCSVFLSRTALFSDRLVVFIGDSDGSPAGIWSARLCVRSGSEGGGIFKGSLGSMLPYIMKAKEDKLGIVLFDDIFKTRCGRERLIAVQRFMTGWRNHVLTSRATHVFIVAYRDGGNLLVEALRSNMKEMQRHISGVAFLQSTHHISSDDTYTLRKMIAQWCLAYMSSPEGVQALKRMKPRETPLGCVVLSAGRVNSDVDVLQTVVSSVYASFKARWSGFRVKNVNSGMEKACYLCKGVFNMRRWRRHCRTCQNPCCEKCSTVENTRHEGQVRLCLTCRALPSLIHWSRPRAVRTGEKESVFSGSAKPGKMSVNDFELVTVIGRGACGKVLLVLKKDGADAGHLYAMKVLKKEWVMNKDLVTQTMAERRILQEADHPYINQDKLYMVMEYYSGGSLRQVLRRRGRFSIKRARFYLAEILLAIAHLHGSNILYRDLKLENIVITADGNVACTDFGLSKEEMDDNERTSSFVGTCEYLAPELIMKDGYGKAVDWWALGILAYEMIQGDSPFRHNVPTILFDKILKEEPEFSDRFTPEAQDLIMKLLTKDPENRLGCGPDGVEEIKQHPFFAEIDWDKLLRMEMEVPRPPHRMEDVTDESHLSRAIAKMREAREEIMPDSPVSLPSSPSEQKHFDRFSYQGLGDWKPEMADMEFDEETGDFKQGTIHEDEEFVEEDYIEESGDGDGVPLSPGSKENSMTSSKASPSKANGSDTPPASSSAASASPRSPQSVGSPGSPPPAPMSPGSPEGSAPCTPTEPQSQTI